MPQSFAALYIHLIWSTRNRKNLIPAHREQELYSYIGGIVRAKKSKLLSAGGTPNHIHLLVSLSRETDVSSLVREIKANSSRWMRDRGGEEFGWQDGFGAFSVSPSNVAQVTRYIERQKEHHLQQAFEEEFELFLARHGVEYDQARLWAEQ